MLGRINNLRASKGLPAYTSNSALTAAAQSQAQWLVDNGCAIAHVHPDGSSPRSRSAAFGYPTVDVSENIYCGTIATPNDAWTFWINSGVHYAGLVNTRYKEIGVASASGGAGTSFVLVFGNPGGPAYVPPASGSGPAAGQGSSGQPSYVLGLDSHGNILHEVQDGDTLGDIALIYGYTWADIPTILAMNGLTWDDIRDLEIGSVLLIPPKNGTYTPTPGGEEPTAAPTDQPTETVMPQNTPTPVATVQDEGILPTPTPAVIAGATLDKLPDSLVALESTATEFPTESPTAAVLEVADASLPGANASPAQPTTAGIITRSGPSPWLGVALVVQAVVLLGAGFEFIRRKRR